MSAIKVPWKLVVAGAGLFFIMLPLMRGVTEPKFYADGACKGEWDAYIKDRLEQGLSRVRESRKKYYQCHYKMLYRVDK